MRSSEYFEWLVSYADTDAGGVMYHARYIELAERSRHRWLRNNDLEFGDIEKEHGCVLLIHSLSATFVKPARLDQRLHVVSYPYMLRDAYSRWATTITHLGQQVCSVEAKIVCIDAASKLLCRMPDLLLKRLQQCCRA